MKPVDVTSNRYIDSSKDINDKDPKFKIGDIVWISRYKNIFTIGYTLCQGHILLVILKAKTLLECFTKRIAKNKSKRAHGWKSNKKKKR